MEALKGTLETQGSLKEALREPLLVTGVKAGRQLRARRAGAQPESWGSVLRFRDYAFRI